MEPRTLVDAGSLPPEAKPPKKETRREKLHRLRREYYHQIQQRKYAALPPEEKLKHMVREGEVVGKTVAEIEAKTGLDLDMPLEAVIQQAYMGSQGFEAEYAIQRRRQMQVAPSILPWGVGTGITGVAERSVGKLPPIPQVTFMTPIIPAGLRWHQFVGEWRERDWKQQIHRQYPSHYYDVRFMREADMLRAVVTPREEYLPKGVSATEYRRSLEMQGVVFPSATSQVIIGQRRSRLSVSGWGEYALQKVVSKPSMQSRFIVSGWGKQPPSRVEIAGLGEAKPKRTTLGLIRGLHTVVWKDWEKQPTYVKEARTPTFWEIPVYQHMAKGLEKYVRLPTEGVHVEFTWAGPKVSKPDILKPVREQALGFVGVVRGAEATIGGIEYLVGRPSVRSYITTTTGALSTTVLEALPLQKIPVIGPYLPIGEGKVTTEYLGVEWESVKEHPQMIGGELLFDILFARYVISPVVSKAWKGAKWLGGKVKTGIVKRMWPERYYYQKYITPTAKVVPEEEAFRVLTKTKKGWVYRPIETTWKTGKKTAWTPSKWVKPEKAKPTTKPWLPPETLRDVTQYVGRGSTLIAKQAVKTVVVQEAKALFKVLPSFALAVYQPQLTQVKAKKKQVVKEPFLVTGFTERFPSIYEMEKEWAKKEFREYPPEKIEREPLIQVPKALQKYFETDLAEQIIHKKGVEIRARQSEKQTALTKTVLTQKSTVLQTEKLRQTQVERLRQIQKGVQLPRQAPSQISVMRQIMQQAQREAQVQRQRQKLQQAQEQARTYPHKLRLEGFKRLGVEGLRASQWYKKTHPILEASDVAKYIASKPSGKRERKPKKDKVAQYILT